MRRVAGLAMVCLLAACALLPKPGAKAAISFPERPQFRLSVAELEIDAAARVSVSLQALPAVSLTPADIAAAWAHQRLAATGAGGQAHFRVLESSVVENTLPAPARVGGYGTSGQERSLLARLRAELVIEDAGGQRRAEGEATAERRIRSALAPPELEAQYDALMVELARRFDDIMTAQVMAALAGF